MNKVLRALVIHWYTAEDFGWKAIGIFLVGCGVMLLLGFWMAPRFGWVWLYCITHNINCTY